MLFYVIHLDVSTEFYSLLAVLYFNELLDWFYITIVLHFVLSGLHTNYSLMEELISCKKAVSKVVPGAPNVSPSF